MNEIRARVDTIVADRDTLDAMTSDRPYRRGGSWEEAGAEIVAQSGRQFDPAVVDAFRAHEPALREICRRFEAVA